MELGTSSSMYGPNWHAMRGYLTAACRLPPMLTCRGAAGLAGYVSSFGAQADGRLGAEAGPACLPGWPGRLGSPVLCTSYV